MDALIQSICYSDLADSLPVHRHSCYQVLFVLKGEIELAVEDRKYLVTGHQLAVINNLETHHIRVLSEEYQRYILYLSPQAADQTIQDQKLLSIFFSRRPSFCHVVDVAGVFDELLPLFERLDLEAHSQGDYHQELCGIFLKILLITLYRHVPSAFPVIETGVSSTIWDLKAYIESNFQQELSLESLAAQFHLSVYYLSHVFKKITGYTVKQYILLCRLSCAKDYLCLSDRSVIDIAVETGFSDHSNFSRYFKRETGCSPSAYRARHTKA